MKITNQPLSSLQRCILSVAKEQETVNYEDILLRFYSFEPSYVRNCRTTPSLSWIERLRLRAARVAICKSFNRLLARGLVVRVHRPGAYSSITLRHRDG